METGINRPLWSEINEFVTLNKMGDVDKFIEECIKIGFNIKQYGATPFVSKDEYKKENKTKKDRVIPTVESKERSKISIGVKATHDKTKINIYDE